MKNGIKLFYLAAALRSEAEMVQSMMKGFSDFKPSLKSPGYVLC